MAGEKEVFEYAKGERLDVFTPIERQEQKSVFVKVGAAWVNRDGSINVTLDALPVNGRLHLRIPSPQSDETPN